MSLLNEHEQVRAALESLLVRQQGEDSPNPEHWDSGYVAHLATYLAPRVAAAIDNSIAFSAHIALTGATDFAPAWDAAFQALRGVRVGDRETP